MSNRGGWQLMGKLARMTSKPEGCRDFKEFAQGCLITYDQANRISAEELKSLETCREDPLWDEEERL